VDLVKLIPTSPTPLSNPTITIWYTFPTWCGLPTWCNEILPFDILYQISPTIIKLPSNDHNSTQIRFLGK
jgi:hypothetical protein